MEAKKENKIIFIKDQLDNSLQFASDVESYFDCYKVFLKDLPDALKKLKNVRRENVLVLISKKFYDDNVNDKVKDFFIDKYSIRKPHYLFIFIDQILSLDEQQRIFGEQNFYFEIESSEDEIPTINYFFLRLIFQRLKDFSRLNDYIVNSFRTIVDSSLINRQKEEIEKIYKELEVLSKIDVLTNVLNRRAFFEAMDIEKSRTVRDLWRLSEVKDFVKVEKEKNRLLKQHSISDMIHKDPQGAFAEHYGRFSCLMIDIDDFKKVNDLYGHLKGDKVLVELGKLLNSRSIFREDDIVGRYGGEEFVVILPETNAVHAKIPAERLREQFRSIVFKSEGKSFNVTISIGISEFNLKDKKTENLINRADKALYYAKTHGKDQVVVYEETLKK